MEKYHDYQLELSIKLTSNIDLRQRHALCIFLLLKNVSEGDGWFFNPKKVTSGSRVDQTWKTPSFCPIDQKTPILHENLVIRTISNVKWVFSDQCG